MSKNGSELLSTMANIIDSDILLRLPDDQDLSLQLDFWLPVIRNCDPLQKFLSNISVNSSYNKFISQKEMCIKFFIDFLVSEFMRSNQFNLISEVEQELIYTFLKRRLQ